ncbi:alanine racemase [Candidatus Microgenomates bacterium]|nr:alanine racemase [Candidatus Microgenomates bacterium]
MLDTLLKIFKKDYRTLNLIEISKTNLINNFKYLSSLNRRIKIAPVIKSNAYGHGIIELAKILDPLGAPFFCVDSLYEAYELLKVHIKTPILIIGYTDPQNYMVKKLPFSYAVYDIETVKILSKYQPGCGVHIFVDTGMHREGISLEDLPNFLTAMKQFKNLKIEGLMSHLASTDDKNDPLNRIQIKNFKKALTICKKYKVYPQWIHIQNSDGLAFNLPGCRLNMARIGLALYGISSDPNLKPVLTLKSKIIQIKKLRRGDRVGYGGTFTAKKDMLMGILPIGYYDGVDRRLSNKGYVLVEGVVCPIIGRVSMNIATVDLSKVANPYIGQKVLVYSNNPKDPNSIENAAKICQTIPYDILVHLAAPIRRVVV